MIKSILVPIDFSECSKNALILALRVADRSNASIELLHICNAFHLTEGKIVEHENNLKIKMNSFIKALNKKGIEFECTIQRGPVVEEILKASNREMSMMIMGTHGASGINNKIFGSNTQKVIIDAGCPVLAVPMSCLLSSIEKVLLAYDYQEMEDPEEIQTLIELVKAFNAKLRILYVNNTGKQIGHDEEQNVKHLQHNLEGIKHKFIYMKSDDVAFSIQKFARNHDYDMIALLPRKHKLLETMMNKRISKEIVNHSTLPVFVFHDNSVNPEA